MDTFKKRTAIRIALTTILLASLVSPMAWFWSLETAEASVVALANEESERLLRRFDAIELNGPEARAHAVDAARAITGGLFDIAEIYDAKGQKLAESMTSGGEAVEPLLPKHGAPSYLTASYESIRQQSGQWILRVFVPLRMAHGDLGSPLTGYFEGVRVMPAWQQDQIFEQSLSMALMVCLASLACGAVLYPVVISLSAQNAQKAREVLDSHIGMMEAIGRAIARRDSDTGAHNYRVAWIAAKMGEALGLSGYGMQSLIVGSFLHDVGKIGIPDAILLKPGRLDEQEMAIMRTHVAQGEKIVGEVGWLGGAKDVVSAHHEKWDGSGYPRGLSGQNIPLAARIFAVADVFDALCSKRPYKEPMVFDAAIHVLESSTGSHFDPEVMKCFRAMANDIYKTMSTLDEAGARSLMEDRVRHHFGV